MRSILRWFFGNEEKHFYRVRVWLYILLSLVCLMLIIGLVSLVLEFAPPGLSFDYQPFQRAAVAFLGDLEAGKIADAYARTTKEYQKEISENQFKAIMHRNPYPTKGKGESLLLHAPYSRKTIKYWHNNNRGAGPFQFNFEVTREGDEYRVGKISLK